MSKTEVDQLQTCSAGVFAEASPPVIKSRETWIDVAKGIGIIAVVLGHSECVVMKYLYWFHMPLFFALSGYLFKPFEDRSAFRRWISKRTQQLLIPYVSFVVLLIVLYYFQHPPTSLPRFGTEIVRILLAGRIVQKVWAVVWFITCLYMTQIVFALITLQGKARTTQMTLVALAFLLAHLEARLYQSHPFPFPWNLDVTLLALAYYSFGYFAKPLLSLRWQPFLTSLLVFLLSLFFVVGESRGWFHYRLDMKYLRYDNLILDLLIPLITLTAVCILSHWIAATRLAIPLIFIGAGSLPIMYLHIWVIHVTRIVYDPGPVAFTLLGVFMPLVIWRFLLQPWSLTRRLFLGTV